MAPEARREGHGSVAMRLQFLDKLVEGKDAGFLEAAHAFSNFEVDKADVGNLDIVVWIIPNLLGDAPSLDPHALAAVHGGATKMIVADVEAKVAGAVVGVRSGAVDMDFGIEHHGDGRGAWIAWVFELVSACCHADSVRLGFLIADAADVVCAGCFSAGWDL